MDADENDESFLECLKIHGYVTSSEDGSDEDESKSELDKLYEDYKPPLFKIDTAKHNVIVIDQSDGESFEDECSSDQHFLHLEGFNKMNFDNKILTPTSDLQQGWTKTLSKRQRRKLKRRRTAINSELCYEQNSEHLKPQCTNSGNNSLYYLETNDFDLDLDKINLNSELGTKNSTQKIKTQKENGGGETFQISDRTCSVVYSTLPDDEFVKQNKPKVRRRKRKKNRISKKIWQPKLGNDFIREDINIRDSSPSIGYPIYSYDNDSYDCERPIRLNLQNDEEREICDESGSIKIIELGQICSDKIEETETWYDQIFENRESYFSSSRNSLCLKNVADVKSANGAGDDFQSNLQTSSVVVGPILPDCFSKKCRSKNRRRKKKKNQTENYKLNVGIDFSREVIDIRNYKFENVAPSASVEYPLCGYDNYSYNCQFMQYKILEENTKTQNEFHDRTSNVVSSSVFSYFVEKGKSKNKKIKKEISKENYGQHFSIQNFEDASWDDKTYRCEWEYCDTGTMADYYLVDAIPETSLGTYELSNSNRDFSKVLMEHIYDITRSVLRWTSSQIVFGILDSFISRNPVDVSPILHTHNIDDICFLFDNFGMY